MSLPPAQQRKKIHTRQITCEAYEREDGLWDIEGHLTDIKTYSFPNRDRGGEIKAGEPVHEMWLRLTLNEALEVQDAVAVTDYGPFAICPNITSNYQRLVGLKIGPGWNRAVRERVGGVEGCTHHTDLLGPMATTAMQAMLSQSRKKTVDKLKNENKKTGDKKKPRVLNQCHALAESSEVVRDFFPEFYKKS